MSDGLRQGWKFRDKNDNTNEVTATLPARLLPSPGAGIAGSSTPIKVISNLSNGNYDVYVPGGPLQGDRLIFQRNASNNALLVRDQSLFNSYFNQNTVEGKKQFETIENNIKIATYDNAQLLTGTDPVRNKNFESIKKSQTYKSLSNSTPPGQRTPGVVPNSNGDPQGASNGTSGSGNDVSEEQATEGLTQLNIVSSQLSDGNNRGVDKYPSRDLLKYPIDLSMKEQDSIRFTMLKYLPKKASISGIASGRPFEREERQAKDRGSTVILPIQSGISDSNSVSWNRDDINAGQAIAAVAALATIKEGATGALETLGSANVLLQKDNQNIKESIAAFYSGQAAQVKGLLTRTTGGIVNPNVELLFQGPELRTFAFNIIMSAREENEAKNIRNIIRFFKQGMSVKRASSDLFLKSPHVFEIKYYNKNIEHPWINKIKECALTACSVNYTPAQTYSTYEDGSMTMYEMTLQFSELEPIYDDDYIPNGGNGHESEIGY